MLNILNHGFFKWIASEANRHQKAFVVAFFTQMFFPLAESITGDMPGFWLFQKPIGHFLVCVIVSYLFAWVLFVSFNLCEWLLGLIAGFLRVEGGEDLGVGFFSFLAIAIGCFGFSHVWPEVPKSPLPLSAHIGFFLYGFFSLSWHRRFRKRMKKENARIRSKIDPHSARATVQVFKDVGPGSLANRE